MNSWVYVIVKTSQVRDAIEKEKEREGSSKKKMKKKGGNEIQAHLAKKDIHPAPSRSEMCAPNCSLTLPSILGFMKSAANRSTSAMYTSIPAEAEFKIPSTIRALGLFSL